MPIDTVFYASVLDNHQDGVIFTDPRDTVTYWNRGMESISGYRSNEIAGTDGSAFFSHLESFDYNPSQLGNTFIDAVLENAQPDETLIWLNTKKGERIPVLHRVVTVRSQDGVIQGSAQTFRDCRMLYEIQSQLTDMQQRASIDFLTGLPNRAFVEMNLRSRIYEFQRSGHSFGVLMLDIDHFKKFNDTHGHDTGDAVLKKVAATLSRNARPYDIIGRWGGEEFLGIAAHVDKLGLYSLAERLRFLVQKNGLKANGKVLRVTVSIGATHFQEGDNQDSVVKRADVNLYQSKENGRNRTTIE